jgi:hypothetical protein
MLRCLWLRLLRLCLWLCLLHVLWLCLLHALWLRLLRALWLRLLWCGPALLPFISLLGITRCNGP